jgi:hypothetical protein
MYESGTDDVGIVRYGVMKNIKIAGVHIIFEFDTQVYFPSELMEEYSHRLCGSSSL